MNLLLLRKLKSLELGYGNSFSNCFSLDRSGWGGRVSVPSSQLVLCLVHTGNGKVDLISGHGLLVYDSFDDVLVPHLVPFEHTLLPVSLPGRSSHTHTMELCLAGQSRLKNQSPSQQTESLEH